MSLEQLAQIQSIDVESKQLAHRRKTLEERSLLTEAEAKRATEQKIIDEVAGARVEAATRQRRLEDEAQIVATRATEDVARLYSGEITGMKDLQALQDEIAGLKSRQESIEDDALVAMEEADSLGHRVADMEQSCAGLDQQVTVLTAEIAASETDIDGQLSELVERRESEVAELDPAMLADYDQLRPLFGSATVVRFNGRKCVGCPSVMPSMEIDRLKHTESGALEHCNECGRIVIL